MVLLGEEAARKICERLPPEALRTLAQEIAQLGSIAPDAAAEVLEEYQHLATATQDSVARGGPDSLQPSSLSRRWAMKRAVRWSTACALSGLRAKISGQSRKPLPSRFVKILQQEHPQTIALVLANLNGAMSKAVLLLLPEPTRTQAVKRLAEMQNFSPEVVQKISAVLMRKLVAPAEKERSSYGGVDTVADLLNRVGPKVTTDLLAGIEKENANLAAKIRNQMFTFFEDLVEVPATGLRELLAQVDKKMLATGLKKRVRKICEIIFSNVCLPVAVEMLKEDMEALGPVRAKDVSQAQSDIVAVARKLESEGKMALKSETEDGYVV